MIVRSDENRAYLEALAFANRTVADALARALHVLVHLAVLVRGIHEGELNGDNGRR